MAIKDTYFYLITLFSNCLLIPFIVLIILYPDSFNHKNLIALIILGITMPSLVIASTCNFILVNKAFKK